MTQTQPLHPDFINFFKQKSYPVHWYINAFTIKAGHKKETFNMAYCTYGKGVAFLDSANGIEWLVIHDVIVHENKCEDGKWCLNINCPANKAEIHHLKRYQIENATELKRVYSKLNRWAKLLKIDEDKHELYTVTQFPKEGLKITFGSDKKCQPLKQ